MSEITKFQEYSKKLQGVCEENDLVYRFRKDVYPVTITIMPSGGVEEQLSMLADADTNGHTSPDARLIFYYLNGELCYKISETFTISDALFSKLKNTYKNMNLYWLMYFFREIVSRKSYATIPMPVIDEGTEDGGDALPPEAEALEEDTNEEEITENAGDPDEALVDQAAAIVRMENVASVSLLQRRLKLGYSKAARIMDELEARGVVGPFNGGQPREVLPVDAPEE